MRPADGALAALYGRDSDTLKAQGARYEQLYARYAETFPGQAAPRFFSASGRAEIGGNHTDHQSGCVLAAAVNLDTVAAAAPSGNSMIRLCSEGFAPVEVDTDRREAIKEEEGTTAAVIRGCVARMASLGHKVGGFNAVMTSNVLVGSGLSSSAAVEVLICTILDGLFGTGEMSPVLRAQVSQFAENEYFGKPSGLMDQMASAVGGIVAIDFKDADPEITAISYDFLAHGYRLAVVNTGGSHDDLTDAYAAIRQEMEQVAQQFGQERLRYVDPAAFEERLPALRSEVSDRALLRALHFMDENARVGQMVAALDSNDLDAFFALIIASGDSSWKLLQNVWASPQTQPIALALELSRRMLAGHGAWRVHGGGFAGTILAFVPTGMYDAYAARMDAVFGKGACCPLDIRAVGACEVKIQ